MRLKARVVHLLNLRMCLEKARNAQRVVILPRDANAERLHAADQHVACVRVNHATQNVVKLPNLLDVLRLAGDAPGENVVVSREVLRRGVDDEVRAKRDGAHVARRAECAVNADESAVLVAQFADPRDVDAPQVRVRRALAEIDGDVVLLERLLESFVVGRVDDGGADSHFGQERLDELACSAVAVCGGDDVSTWRHERHEHGGCRVHSAAGDEAVLRHLHFGYFLLSRHGCWVAVPSVLERLVTSLLIGDEFRGILEGERCGLHDGRGERVLHLGSSRALSSVHADRSRSRRLGQSHVLLRCRGFSVHHHDAFERLFWFGRGSVSRGGRFGGGHHANTRITPSRTGTLDVGA
mmetsp:Transcript_130/g.441  ORF Transcript_130/g.441 Transcript_130/m.441 type:complete len:353 (+) Transcript_130:554-1612(+)